MIKNLNYTILILLLFSCNSKSNQVDLTEVLKTSKNPELDMVFYEIIESLRYKNGQYLAIVDKAIDDSHDSIFDITPLYWNKSIFPNVRFINGDSLFLYNEADKMHQYFTKKYVHGFLEITHPYFINADKGIAHVRAKLYRGNEIKVYSYILEKEINKYIIKEEEYVVSIQDNAIHFAPNYYQEYLPYDGFMLKDN
ncbi:hypothetical protein [uncultured Aquimarina sp.]|uniref:hypothetical protein n=1 Tax=uncultured Aquimarina sp. TaxID=575652 RepID=UPI002631317A|nr:hypothetical protein [uncultured Aquimarina sp.]